MTRKATPKAKSKTTTSKPAKKPKKPTKPKKVPAYVVVREVPAEAPSWTEPERVFATKAAAGKFAEERNRELRQLVNPFARHSPEYVVKGGEKAFIALVKGLDLPVPAKDKTYNFIDWEEWWDRHYFDMTDAQRDIIWDALDKYNWYIVKTTTVE